jgi:hypothetical protein
VSIRSQIRTDPSASGTSTGTSSLYGNLRRQLAAAGADLWKQRVWLLFLVPFAFACWKPLQNSFRNWGNPNNLLLFQSLVPLAVALLIWQGRSYLQALWIKLQTLPEKDKRRRGNMIPLAVGCLIVFFGNLVYVDSFFGIGLLLILVGTIYYIYGGVILRAMAGPLSLLILMVNPPDSLISRISGSAIESTAFATSSFLSLLGRTTSVDKSLIRFPDRFVEVTDSLGGANILLAVLFIAFVCAWYQRRTPLYTFCFMVLTSVLVVFVHLIRVSIYALTAASSPGVSKLFASFNAWVMVLVLGATIIYAAQSMDLLFLRMKVAAKQREKYGIQKKRPSNRIEKKLINPFFNACDKGVLYLSTQHRKNTKSLNALLKKVMPASKKKNRSRW